MITLWITLSSCIYYSFNKQSLNTSYMSLLHWVGSAGMMINKIECPLFVLLEFPIYADKQSCQKDTHLCRKIPISLQEQDWSDIQTLIIKWNTLTSQQITQYRNKSPSQNSNSTGWSLIPVYEHRQFIISKSQSYSNLKSNTEKRSG